MGDVPRIEGTPDPRSTSRTAKEGEIDPEKFKKIMKVDESDETNKRHKRNRSEEEQETEEEEEAQEAKGAAPGFSALMSDNQKKDSLFNSPASAQQSSNTGEEAPPSPFYNPGTSQNTPSIPNSGPGLVITPSSTTSSNSSPASSSEDQPPPAPRKAMKEVQKTTKKELTSAINTAKKSPKEAKKAEPLLSQQKIESEKLSEKPTKEEAHLEKREEREKKVSETLSTFEPERKKIESHASPTDTHFIDLEKKKEKAAEAELESEARKEKEKREEKESSTLQSQGNVSFSQDHIQPLAQTELPRYTSLSTEVYNLYERMVGLITVQQTSRDSKTTVTLNMPGSIFNKAQIVLEKFSTSPNTFNIQLMGSPRAVEVFNASMDDLIAAFQDHKRSFEVNIQRPYLLKEYQESAKKTRSSSKGDKQGKGDKDHER